MNIDKEFNMEECTGAGIVVYYDNRDHSIKGLTKDIVYLTLTDRNGYYDFPKGGIDLDFGEYSFDCALRETDEEINLKRSDFEMFYGEESKDGFPCGRGLIMFIGKIKKESIGNAKRKVNEKTRLLEHIDNNWLTREEILSEMIEIDGLETNKLPMYLQQCLNWASQKIV